MTDGILADHSGRFMGSKIDNLDLLEPAYAVDYFYEEELRLRRNP